MKKTPTRTRITRAHLKIDRVIRRLLGPVDRNILVHGLHDSIVVAMCNGPWGITPGSTRHDVRQVLARLHQTPTQVWGKKLKNGTKAAHIELWLEGGYDTWSVKYPR